MYALKSIGRAKDGGARMASFDPAYFRAQGWWRDETLRGWLERHRAADRAAVRTFDDTLTYAGFAAREAPSRRAWRMPASRAATSSRCTFPTFRSS